MRFAPLYGLGVEVGIQPAAVDAMSLWQFRATVSAVADFRAAADGGLTSEDIADLSATMDKEQAG